MHDPAGPARRYGVVRQTVHGWLRRYAEDGLGGLADRSPRPLMAVPGMYPQMRLVAGLPGSHCSSSEPRGAVCRQMQSWY